MAFGQNRHCTPQTWAVAALDPGYDEHWPLANRGKAKYLFVDQGREYKCKHFEND
jgi:hypothetical protein